MKCGSIGDAVGNGTGTPTTPPSFHEVSLGRISVAIPPGGVLAAATAAAASPPTRSAVVAVLTQLETGLAQLSTSAVNGASSGRW
jgi:hypothetical protein